MILKLGEIDSSGDYVFALFQAIFDLSPQQREWQR